MAYTPPECPLNQTRNTDFLHRSIPQGSLLPKCRTGYRPPPGCCMPPGQEQYPCIPDQCRKTPNSGSGDDQTATCAQKNYKYMPSRCRETTECSAPQCSTGYRPPPGCCKPPGQEQYPCYPDPCPKETPQCSTGYRPPPGCCKPPGQEQYPCYPDPSPKEPPQCSTGYRPPPGCCKPPDPCGKTAKQTHVCTRETYEFAPSRCALKTNACSTGYRPPQGCCMPPGQEHRPCMPDPCTKTANSDTCLNNTPLYDRMKYEFAPSRCPLKTKECAPSQCCKGYRPPPGCCKPPGQEQYPCIPEPCYNQPMQCTRKKCTEPDVALAMGYGAPIGQRVTPSNCSW